MSGKKSKEKRKEGQEVVASINIVLLKNGNVTFVPLDDWLITLKIINAAESLMLDNIAEQIKTMKQAEHGRIIKPGRMAQ